MDGLAATRAIRAIERERIAPSIPIIALTASASPQDIERSANAGCDAHLSKPISKPELIGAIEKYRRHLKSPEAEGIGIEAQERLRNLVPEMVELLARSDFARLAILGHDLKGSSGWGGFPELNRMGAAVEQFAKQKNSGDLRAQMTALARYLEHAEVTTKA
jgi:CheY-like chemotaxis protein